MSGPQVFHPETRRVLDLALRVGESPVWDARTGDLWLVDILAPAALVVRAGGRLERFDMPAAIGCLALCESGAVAVCLQTGVHILDPATGRLVLLCDPDGGRPHSRLNDGKVGPDGCLYVGTRDEAVPQTGNAVLYRVAPDGGWSEIAQGLRTSNGLAWSPDGRRMYHSDSTLRFVQVFDFDPAAGPVGAPRRLWEPGSPEVGRPDGAATDAQGFYWSAGIQSGGINRISPDGELREIYKVPAACPTMPCFGGPDLKTLFVTSLHNEQNGAPEPGTLLAFAVDVAGAPVPRFAL